MRMRSFTIPTYLHFAFAQSNSTLVGLELPRLCVAASGGDMTVREPLDTDSFIPAATDPTEGIVQVADHPLDDSAHLLL